jgi:hypothetical protein
VADSPYFQSANTAIDADKKALLEAVAGAGTAGAQAYQQSKASIDQAKQDAVGRAAQRAALFGAGGNDQTFGGAYDSRLGQLDTNNQSFQQGLQSMSAANQGYLENARSAIPTLSAINANKRSAQEATIKSALELARQKAQDARDLELQKEAAADARAQKSSDRADARADRSDKRAADREAAKPPTSDQLLGHGKSLADLVNAQLHPTDAAVAQHDPTDVDNAVFAANQLGGLGLKSNQVDPDAAARAYAKSLGMDDATINSILTPGKLNTYSTAMTKLMSQPATPDVKWLTSNVRGMDNTKAQQALAAPEFQEAGRQVLSYFAQASVDDKGKINDGQGYDGMTPKDAFHKYVYSQQGNLTMKDAAFKYYGNSL